MLRVKVAYLLEQKAPAPPTREDRLHWLHINVPLGEKRWAGPYLSDLYHSSDRRDANLMLDVQCMRSRGIISAQIQLNGIDCAGWLDDIPY
jgi:hypothetical protein